MNKLLNSATIAIISVSGLALTCQNALAAPSTWSSFSTWFNSKPIISKPYWINGNRTLPAAIVNATYAHRVNLTTFIRDSIDSPGQLVFILEGKHPVWIEISKDGLYLQGNHHKVISTTAHTAIITISAKNLKTKQISAPQTFEIPIENIELNLSEEASINLHKLINLKQSHIDVNKQGPDQLANPPSPELKDLVKTPEIQPVQIKDKTHLKSETQLTPTEPKKSTKTSAVVKSPPTLDNSSTIHNSPVSQPAPVANAVPPLPIKDENLKDVVNQTSPQPEIVEVIPVPHIEAPQSAEKKILKIASDPQGAEPRWSISSIPDVAIAQKNYEEINLNDYVSDKINKDNFLYSLTPGKNNAEWVSLQANGILSILTDKISPEDINTTQIIYLTANSTRSGKSSSVEITIKIIANDKLPAPQWQPNFKLADAIISKPYIVDLSSAVKTDNLADNDQLTFQIIDSLNWLNIGDNGFSLVGDNIPETDANQSKTITLRVSSKMSGKSSDFNGTIFVNAAPQPLHWQPLPDAVINKNYSIDLNQYISSNIKNDHFTFEIDLNKLPSWLSLQNKRILTGTPQDAHIIDLLQEIDVTAHSLVSGLTSKITLNINVNADEQLIPQWKKDFLQSPLIDEPYRSDDLASALENSYLHDDLKFEYLKGPSWLSFNSLCHCLTTKGNVPADASGKIFNIKLRAHSKASGKTIDYQQLLMVYTGIPLWTKTVLPDVKIAQSESLEIPLADFTKDDISGDQFDFNMDKLHSPRWVSLIKKANQSFLVIDSNAISANEVNTSQTVRLIATSQSTHKSSAQLLTIKVLANTDLPGPVWRLNHSLPVATVGVSHATDLNEFLHNPMTNDQLQIKLGKDSPSWLSVANNRLLGSPPRSAIGGPYPVTLLVHSKASNQETIIRTQINAQLVVVADDNMETHSFYDNHQSIVIRGLKKNHKYRLFEVKGSHFDYGPFYSPHPIKTGEDWDNNPFYAVGHDQMIESGDDGVVSIVYYTLPNTPAPQFELIILR